MQLQPLKLVTIVTEQVLRDQLAQKILELGATGCTSQDALGTGSRGARQNDVFGGNVRFEIVCSPAVADAILTHVSHNYFEHYACIAWVTDVSVVRGTRYVK
jgi:nitrogen regulatory protein P-II 2